MTKLAPPVGGKQSFIELANDATVARWLADLSSNASTPRQRKDIVKNLRDLIQGCAAEQAKACAATNVDVSSWIAPASGLPACYEEVRILYDGLIRIARLAHTKEYFQLSCYVASAKSQYIVTLDKVTGWQPLAGIPAVPGTAET